MADDERGLLVHQFELGPWDNFIYLLADRVTKTCAVVDPAWHADSIRAEAQKLGLSITHMLCTHSHFDHVDQVEEMLKTHDIPVHMLGEEIDFSGFRCENLVRARPGDSLRIGDHVDVTFMHTPGHTPGSTSYRIRDGVVTGDTLFIDGCGRCDFVGGEPEVMYQTLCKLVADLPPQTRLYPGHDYGPTPTDQVRGQRQTNPYLRHATVEDFVKHRMEGKTPNTTLPRPAPWPPEG